MCVETGGDEKQILKLTKELRAVTQKAKSEMDFRPMAKHGKQRWTSTDDDYKPDRPKSRPPVYDDLESRSRPRRDSRSRSDDHGSDSQRVRTRDSFRQSSSAYDDDGSNVILSLFLGCLQISK